MGPNMTALHRDVMNIILGPYTYFVKDTGLHHFKSLLCHFDRVVHQRFLWLLSRWRKLIFWL